MNQIHYIAPREPRLEYVTLPTRAGDFADFTSAAPVESSGGAPVDSTNWQSAGITIAKLSLVRDHKLVLDAHDE